MRTFVCRKVGRYDTEYDIAQSGKNSPPLGMGKCVMTGVNIICIEKKKGWMDAWLDGCMDGCRNGGTVCQPVGRMKGWMDENMLACRHT